MAVKGLLEEGVRRVCVSLRTVVRKRALEAPGGVEAIDRRNPTSHIRVFTPNNPGTAMCRELRHDRKKREQTQS